MRISHRLLILQSVDPASRRSHGTTSGKSNETRAARMRTRGRFARPLTTVSRMEVRAISTTDRRLIHPVVQSISRRHPGYGIRYARVDAARSTSIDPHLARSTSLNPGRSIHLARSTSRDPDRSIPVGRSTSLAPPRSRHITRAFSNRSRRSGSMDPTSVRSLGAAMSVFASLA